MLDLMMPDLSGVDVLKFIRSEPSLVATPVVVLTNAYLNDLGRQATAIGIQKAMLKAQCSPSVLMACVDELLDPKAAPNEPAQMTNAPTTPPSPPTTAPPPHRAQREAPSEAWPTEAEGPTPRQVGNDEPGTKADKDFLAYAPTICADLRKLFQVAAQQYRNGQEQQMRLQNLYRPVHFLAAAAGGTEYTQLTQTAVVFEALLYVLMKERARFRPSVWRTLANLVDFVELLFRHAGESLPGSSPSVAVLVVDDDPVSNRLLVSALRAARLEPYSTDDPLVAWQWANHEHFDLILLDIEMPGLNGFEFCRRLRAVPGYELTPVIFVTAHSDFESRAKSSVSDGDDLIAKPILPMELAAKVVMHLLKGQVLALSQPV